MSKTDDRIPVPTNGHRPPATAGRPTAAPAPAPPPAAAAPSAHDDEAAGEPKMLFTPGQAAVGFGIIAGLILLVLGRRRGRKG